MNGGTAEAWLISFTKQLRVNLPQGSYFLTHARTHSHYSKAALTNTYRRSRRTMASCIIPSIAQGLIVGDSHSGSALSTLRELTLQFMRVSDLSLIGELLSKSVSYQTLY